MAADVRSIDALREWHAAATTYGSSLLDASSSVAMEIRRGFDWLAEQQARWQRSIRDCEDEVTRAKAELSARKFTDWSGREPDTTVQEKALRLAKAKLEHAEDQVEKIRAWIGRLPKMIEDIYDGPARKLTTFLEVDLARGQASLNRRIGSLENYAGLRPDYSPAPSAGSALPPAPSPAPPEAEA